MSNTMQTLRLILTAIILLAAHVAAADDWPVARGDQAGTGVAASPVGDSLDVLWQYKAGETAFEVTPVVAAGVVYLGDADGGFHAVSLADGAKKWSVTFEESGFLAAAAVSGDRIVCGDFDGQVRCLSTKDGAVLWEFDAETEVYAGPVFHESNVLVCTEGGVLFGLNADSGEKAWAPFTIEAPLRCSPTLGEGRVLLAGCDAKLHAIDASTGKEVASVDIGAATGNTAASRGGRSFFGTENGAFLAVDVAEGMTVAWTYTDPQRGQGIRTAAAAGDSAVVFANQGKIIYAVDPENGELLWRQPTRSRVEGSPVIAGNRVIVATSRGRVLQLDLASGEEVWQYEAGGSFLAAAAVVDGKVLIANDEGVLYCFGEEN